MPGPKRKDAACESLKSYLDALFSQLLLRLSELCVLFTVLLNSFHLSWFWMEISIQLNQEGGNQHFEADY